MTDSTNTPPDVISGDELQALAAMHWLRSEAERSGLPFSARLITPSGRYYMVATDEPGNLAAWILQQEENGRMLDTTGD